VEASDGRDCVKGLWLKALEYARGVGAAAEHALRSLEHHRLRRSPNCSAADPTALGAAVAHGARTQEGEHIEVLRCEDELFTQLPLYYTNFEVASLGFLRSEEYRASSKPGPRGRDLYSQIGRRAHPLAGRAPPPQA